MLCEDQGARNTEGSSPSKSPTCVSRQGVHCELSQPSSDTVEGADSCGWGHLERSGRGLRLWREGPYTMEGGVPLRLWREGSPLDYRGRGLTMEGGVPLRLWRERAFGRR